MAAAEANAIGALKEAEVALCRLQYQTSILEQLHSRNLATDKQLLSHQEKVAAAEKFRDLERERIARRNAVLQSMAKELTQTQQSETKSEFVEPTPPDQWPNEILADTDRLRHLLKLRREYYNLQGHAQSSDIKQKMQLQTLVRLKDSLQKSQSSQANLQITGDAQRLKKAMELGEQRQVDLLDMTIAALEANAIDANEQCVVLILEESRFILQCQHQCNATTESLVSVPIGFQSVDARPRSVPRSSITPASYIECREPGDLYDDLVFDPRWQPKNFQFELARGVGLPLQQG